MALSTKQRAFVDAYTQHWNASRAARDAGYSEKTAGQIGHENLKKPEIAAEIEARIAALLPKGEIVQRLAARSRSTIADVLRLPFIGPMPEGLPPQAIDSWAIDLIKAQQSGAIHQIKKIKAGKWGPEIEMYDPLPAWELVGKFLKFVDDGGILKHLDVSKLTPEQLERLANGDDPLAILLNTPATESTGGAGA